MRRSPRISSATSITQDAAERSVRIDGDLERGLEWAPLFARARGACGGPRADRRRLRGGLRGSAGAARPHRRALAASWQCCRGRRARQRTRQCLAELCERCGIPHPRLERDACGSTGWLAKRLGGCGRIACRLRDSAGERTSTGRSASRASRSRRWCSADGTARMVLGFSAQWADPLPDAPFRYGGAVRPADRCPRDRRGR